MTSEGKEEEKEENEQYQQNRSTFKYVIMAFITKFMLVKKRFIYVLTYYEIAVQYRILSFRHFLQFLLSDSVNAASSIS
jgi:hypothetical protein